MNLYNENLELMMLVKLNLYFNIVLTGLGTNKRKKEANHIYHIQDSNIFDNFEMLNTFEIKGNEDPSIASFLHKYPENLENEKQDFSKYNNDHKRLKSKSVYGDSAINNVPKRPTNSTDHDIESENIDQDMNKEFLANERFKCYNNKANILSGKKVKFIDTNTADVIICKSSKFNVTRNFNQDQNTDTNKMGENEIETLRLPSFDTLKNHLKSVRSDNISCEPKDVVIKQQSSCPEYYFHDSLEYGQGNTVKESSINYENLENMETTHLLTRETSYHNKIIYGKNEHTKEYIHSEINPANIEHCQSYIFNTLNYDTVNNVQHSIHPNLNVNIGKVEESVDNQCMYNTYCNSNILENNIYANYGDYTHIKSPSTFSDCNTLGDCFISQNVSGLNNETELNKIDQLFLLNQNCRRDENGEKNHHLTDINKTNEPNFAMETCSSLYKSITVQVSSNDQYIICNDTNDQKLKKEDLQSEFFECENSVSDIAKEQKSLSQTDNLCFLKDQASYIYNSPLSEPFSKKEDKESQQGKNIRISRKKNTTLVVNNEKNKINIISDVVLDSKSVFNVFRGLEYKNGQILNTNFNLTEESKIKQSNEAKATDKYTFLKNFGFCDKNIIKELIENILNNCHENYHDTKDPKNVKIKFFQNNFAYFFMIDYLLSSIEEYCNLENPKKDNFSKCIMLNWSFFYDIYKLFNSILVIEENHYFKTYYENIKMRKYNLNKQVFTKYFFSDLRRILHLVSSLKFFNLFLPEFLSYNEKYSLESCFEKENDIELNILQIKYFITLKKFVGKIYTFKTEFLNIKNRNIQNNFKYYIRKFTYIALQPFFKCNFKNLYNNLIVKGIQPSTRKVLNNIISIEINGVMNQSDNIKFLINSYHIRFLFLYIDFQKIFENNFNVFNRVKNFEKRFIYHDKNKYEIFNINESFLNLFIREYYELSEIIFRIKKNKKCWFPYCKILLIYLDKILNLYLLNEKIKNTIKQIKDKILEFFISCVVDMEKSEISSNENKNKYDKKVFYDIFAETKKIILEIEEVENICFKF